VRIDPEFIRPSFRTDKISIQEMVSTPMSAIRGNVLQNSH